jgi:hypothetical protein
VVKAGNIANTRGQLEAIARSYAGSRVVLECGTHSPWVSRYLEVGEKITRVFALCGIELNRAKQILATVREMAQRNKPNP